MSDSSLSSPAVDSPEACSLNNSPGDRDDNIPKVEDIQKYSKSLPQHCSYMLDHWLMIFLQHNLHHALPSLHTILLPWVEKEGLPH